VNRSRINSAGVISSVCFQPLHANAALTGERSPQGEFGISQNNPDAHQFISFY
jgi:hypothetical protein